MANLEFCDKHNMVAYLKKTTGCEGFQEIVYFLNGSHLRYALTKNPTIYVSLIEKFWQTAIVRTVDNREQEITATVDGKEFTITEASVRRHLQLADVDGISVLPTTEIFDQLSLMSNMKRGFSGEHTPLFPSMLAIQAEEGEGSGHPSEPQPPPSTAQPTNEEPIPNVVSSSHQKTQTPRQALNQVTELPQTSEPIPNVPDEAVYKECSSLKITKVKEKSQEVEKKEKDKNSTIQEEVDSKDAAETQGSAPMSLCGASVSAVEPKKGKRHHARAKEPVKVKRSKIILKLIRKVARNWKLSLQAEIKKDEMVLMKLLELQSKEHGALDH
ncbi:hypothetical protein Tco_0855226 [Tanacetum coccineum]